MYRRMVMKSTKNRVAKIALGKINELTVIARSVLATEWMNTNQKNRTHAIKQDSQKL